MKHLILTSALFLTATLGFAQNITEPEYKGQVAVINADSTTTLLQKETGEHKAKSSAFALVPIPGASLLDRTKAYLTVKGAESPNKISSKKFSLIIRVKDNSEEPKTPSASSSSKPRRRNADSRWQTSASAAHRLPPISPPLITRRRSMDLHLTS